MLDSVSMLSIRGEFYTLFRVEPSNTDPKRVQTWHVSRNGKHFAVPVQVDGQATVLEFPNLKGKGENRNAAF